MEPKLNIIEPVVPIPLKPEFKILIKNFIYYQIDKSKPASDLPQQVGRYLVVNLGQDPDWVWELKAVVKPVEGGKKSVRRFRVYDPVQSAKQWIKIIDYHSLDDYPELILYEGDYDKDTNAVSFSVREPAKAA